MAATSLASGGARPTASADPIDALRRRFAADLGEARQARRQGDVDEAWRLLEEAHVLSQSFAGLHVRSHVAMLGLAVQLRDPREIAGQAIRIVLAAPASLAGRFPPGNTGRAHVRLLERMPVDPPVQALLDGARRRDRRRGPIPTAGGGS